MKITKNRLLDLRYLAITMILWQGVSFEVFAVGGCKLLTADRLFDGFDLQNNAAVLIQDEKVKQVGTQEQLKNLCTKTINLGNATILPGFIESHAHITFQKVRKNKVLQHGITTVQDTGGPLLAPMGGDGKLRLLSVGSIIQAPGGYPLNIFGPGSGGPYEQIGYPVSSEAEARSVVQSLVDGGATAIKIALEPGGEPGAPWMMPHGDQPVPPTPWRILSQSLVDAIVDEAHHPHAGRPVRRVIAHVGENAGFKRALAAGIDEFAHMPCAAIDPALLLKAANTPGLTFVTTVDTLSSCVKDGMGVHSNTMQLAGKVKDCETKTPGNCAEILYGSEIGHDNVPWGINGEEMHLMLHLTSGDAIDFTDVINVFKAATSKAGEHLGIDKLGTLTPDAPADIIAVRGNPFKRFKLLEYPDLVISGGRMIVNNFK